MSKNIITVMLDTNILIDFVLIQWKKIGLTEKLKRSKVIYDSFINQDFLNSYSRWNNFELRDQLYQLTLNDKMIKYGYNLSEFSEAKKDVRLDNKEKEGTEEIIQAIKSTSVEHGGKLNLDHIEQLTRYGISMMDAILLYQAAINPYCLYFVTRDNVLRQQVAELPFTPRKIKLLGRKEFINLVVNKEILS